MTPKLTFGLLIIALIGALTFSFSGTQPALAESEHEVLEHNMEIMGSAFRQIRRQARSKKFDQDTLKQLERMQTSALLAMHANEEEHITKKDDVIQYRSMMADLIKKLLDMEIAVLKEDHTAAAACVDDLNTIMKSGHNKYKDH
ncbi:MAG TPA: hypothetical protein DCM28_13660 [Phycisphaerales bacterium]|nr:hypothetical protein [Phycisphaerales bacterium]HCD33749.1 hypothetical protein [Phycisphaerales bacterium]|tara:strand:- start:909 stop:1340 length:432 start_codon:yes stop_codon:yes gene_type:complete